MNLAQQAIHHYDQNGEKAMLSFLKKNLEERDSLPDGPDPGLIILKDHTAVEPGGYAYTFLWMEEKNGRRVYRSHIRVAHLGWNQCPKPRQRSIPLLPWPDQNSVWEAAMRQIEGRACEQLGLEQDLEDPPLIILNQAVDILPDLKQPIQDHMTAFHLNDTLLQELDSHQTACGESLVKGLPPEQLALLIQESVIILQQRE